MNPFGQPETINQNKRDILAILLFAVFCVIFYFNSLWGIFVFDDFHTIPDNLFIKSARHIPLFFKGEYTSELGIPRGMFRPLLMITFVFNYAVSRLQPLGYHLVNILFHFLNVVLLYCFLRFFKKSLPFGLVLMLSLLFLAHPINTEAVTYISARSDLMACFFVVLSFLCYVRGRFFWTVALYILGLLSKETPLVLPFLIFGYDFLNNPRQTSKRKYILYAALIAISAIYWLYRQHLYGSTLNVMGDLHRSIRNPYSNILTQSAVSIFYLRLFIWPYPLSMHHNFPTMNSLLQPFSFVSVVSVIAIIALAFFMRKKQFIISVALFWYFICLLPKFYIPLNVVAAEHHFYLPSFGIYLLLAVLLQGAYLRFKRKFTIIFLGVFCIFFILVWSRNYEYSSEYVFWRKATEADSSSAVAHHNLGIAYVHRKRYEEAEKELKKAIALSSPSAKRVIVNSRDNLSNVYRLQKRYKEALAELNKVIELKLDNFGTYQNLGVIYLDMGEEEKAVEAWQTGLSLNPEASGILLNLGMYYLRKSQFSKAGVYFKESVKYDPDSSIVYFGLGRAFQELGKDDSAIKAFVESLSLNPNYADTHYYLGVLYLKKLDPRAENEFKYAVELVPEFGEAHNNLAVLYASMEPPKLELARHHAREAVSCGYNVDKEFLKIIGINSAHPSE